MAVYTWSPPETFEARQINTQADADEWIASLTEDQLRNENDQVEIRDLTVTVDAEQVSLRFIRADSLDAMPNRIDVPIGGYLIAARTSINLWAEDEENFLRRFEVYAQLPA